MAESSKHLGINFSNQKYILETYELYRKDREMVSPEMRAFFEGVDFAAGVEGSEGKKQPPAPAEIRVLRLLESYKRYGHLASIIHPMKYSPGDTTLLSLEANGFSKEEESELFPTLGMLEQERAPLSEIVKHLNQIYCRTLGFECYGLQNVELENWFHQRILKGRPPLPKEEKVHALRELCRAKSLEEFLHRRFIGAKRFSIEGGETLIPMLGELLDEAAKADYEKGVICMAHRGRINVLCNIMGKPYGELMYEFNAEALPAMQDGMGDVKYHKGYHSTFETHSGKKIEMSLASNPSHLESVDPVMMGMVRGIMDKQKRKVLPIMIHGDASVAGQGVVYEVMQFCKLKGYGIDGTIHIVVNNQIGFTATPDQSRSTRYCTDIAKTFDCPVIHVNSEDVDAALYAIELALETKSFFNTDVFIDLGCYRQYGHNEGDEPVFTNPHLYSQIKTKEQLYRSYRMQLIQEGLVTEEKTKELEEEIKGMLEKAFDEAKQKGEGASTEISCALTSELEYPRSDLFENIETKIGKDRLVKLAESMTHIPQEFNAHPKIRKIYEERKNALLAEGESRIDWGCAETLAYASLLEDGVSVRISGQDSQRGTFSHRHSVLYDQKEDEHYIPLCHIQKDDKATFQVYNSALSEYAALGYEFGYTLTYPESLVIWEAQFGDFVNGAQIIIDQFIASSETKWNIRSSLVMFLPHGYEGMGSEHSSSRIERMLQLAAMYNIRICYPSSPSQFFHLLRRQAKSANKKPLIALTPKSMLRYPPSFSAQKDLVEGSFCDILDDTSIDKATVKTVLLCSGKIYYDLLKEREEKGLRHIALVRIEQLYPLDVKKVQEIIQSYQSAEKFVWVQEEPSNQGFWSYMHPYLVEILGDYHRLQYVGRGRCSSTATGFASLHKKEQREIIERALKE